jgi:hypothetical protein
VPNAHGSPRSCLAINIAQNPLEDQRALRECWKLYDAPERVRLQDAGGPSTNPSSLPNRSPAHQWISWQRRSALWPANTGLNANQERQLGPTPNLRTGCTLPTEQQGEDDGAAMQAGDCPLSLINIAWLSREIPLQARRIIRQ